ncbi:MAG: ABC transporter ATP-binding protein [Bacteroidales bacterium]
MCGKVLLETKGLTVGYGKDIAVLSGLDITLNAGELVCIIGANGSGKSTLLRTLADVQKPLVGEVLLGGVSINEMRPRHIAKEIGLVFTESTNAGGLTVTELVSLGRYPHTGFFGRLNVEDKRIVSEAIKSVGVAHKSESYVAELSDGERQKVMIAKALAQQTPLILLDEPTAFLDIASKIETMRLLHELAREQGKGVIVSSHDISQALLLSDRLWIVTADGELIQGGTEDLILSGMLNNVFKGDSIRFDQVGGNFVSSVTYSKSVSLSGTNDELIHWCKNALQRNGINTITEKTDIQVEIENPYSILLKNRDGVIISSHRTIADMISELTVTLSICD